MKKYNFDEIINRRNTDCIKWDGLELYYNSNDLIPMWVADMEFRCCDEIVEALTSRAEHGIYGYGIKLDDYYEAMIGWYNRRHGIELQRSNIVYLPNVVTGLRFAVSAFTQKGDGVTILSPVYGPFNKSVEDLGREVIKCPLKRKDNTFVIDFKLLDNSLSKSKVLFFCSPHNPVGRVWTLEEVERVAELCIKHNVVLVSDEIHCDLVQKGHKFTSVLSLREELNKNTVALISVSKTFNCAGLLGAAALTYNKEIRKKLNKQVIDFNLYLTNVFTIAGVKAAYNYGADWVDQVVDYIGENYRYMCDFIEKNIPEVKVMELQGTYLAFLDCHGIAKDEKELKTIMEEKAKIAGKVGSDFGEEGTLYYRINLAVSRKVLEEAMNNLYRALYKD